MLDYWKYKLVSPITNNTALQLGSDLNNVTIYVGPDLLPDSILGEIGDIYFSKEGKAYQKTASAVWSSFLITSLDLSSPEAARTSLELGTSATINIGTAANEIPLNGNLGSASTYNVGTGATEIPLNQDLGSAAFNNIGTGGSDIPVNSSLGSAAFKDAGSLIGNVLEVIDVGGVPGLGILDGSQLINVAGGSSINDSTTTTSTTWSSSKIEQVISSIPGGSSDWADITNKPTSTVVDIDLAVTKMHDQNSDIALAEGTADEILAADIRDFIDSKGIANGLATLDVAGKLPITQLPTLTELSYSTIILADESTIADFATNSGNYTFDVNALIIIVGVLNDLNYYQYMGPSKTDSANYVSVSSFYVEDTVGNLLEAVAWRHQQNSDLYLAFGTADEVSATDLKQLLTSAATINDSTTVTTSTWSSTKIQTELDNIVVSGAIDDNVTGTSTTWSSSKMVATFTGSAGSVTLDAVNMYTKAQRGAFVTATGTSISLDMSAANFFDVTLTGVSTLDATNVVGGQSGDILLRHDGTTITFDSKFKFQDGVTPILSSGTGKLDRLSYLVVDATTILASMSNNWS